MQGWNRRRFEATFAVMALVASTSSLASAQSKPDTKACIAASEKGQQARAAGKLREAHDQLLVCAMASCPSLVRKDCAQWNGEIAQAMPSVVLAARDKNGKDFFDVAVSVDGEPLVTKLDGKAVAIDPGKHVFRFESAGLTPVTETVLIREGERARNVTATFELPTAPAPVVAPPVVAPVVVTPAKREHTVYPWIVVGAGAAAVVAGVVVLATAPSRPSNCDKATATCTAAPGESAAQLADEQSRATTADARPTIGLVVGGIGLAATAVGLVWHFLEPTGPKKAGLRIAPWTTGTASGVVLGRAF